MTNRNVFRALAAAWLTCGVAAVAPVAARAQDVSTLPKGHVTLVGCFLRVADSHDTDDERYVLANATLGPATSVPDPNCTATGSEPVLKLTEVHQHHLDQAMTGRWMEINGELGSIKDADDLRKFEVKSFREVPVTPRVAIVIPRPEPLPEAPVAAPVETPAPAATTGVEPKVENTVEKKLPHTASPLPLIALLGFFGLTGGLVFGAFHRRRVAEARMKRR